MEIANVTVESAKAEDALERIRALSGVDLRDCYQCGKCAAGCPVAPHADMSCRQVIRNLQLGLVDPVLHVEMPWACLGCATCVARCPQNVDMPSLMVAIKQVATERGIVASRDAKVFEDVFLGIVRQTGVSDEALLAAGYNVGTGHLFQDVAGLPTMLKNGLIEVALPRSIDNTDEMKALFDRCRAAAQGSAVSEGASAAESEVHHDS